MWGELDNLLIAPDIKPVTIGKRLGQTEHNENKGNFYFEKLDFKKKQVKYRRII